jgi:hypothetical protein
LAGEHGCLQTTEDGERFMMLDCRQSSVLASLCTTRVPGHADNRKPFTVNSLS